MVSYDFFEDADGAPPPLESITSSYHLREPLRRNHAAGERHARYTVSLTGAEKPVPHRGPGRALDQPHTLLDSGVDGAKH